MESLFDVKLAALLTAIAALSLLIVGQTIHTFHAAARTAGRLRTAVTLYESLLITYLTVMTSSIYAAAGGSLPLTAGFHTLALPLEPLLWINLLTAGIGFALAVRRRRIRMIPELIILLLGTPPALQAAGTAGSSGVVVLLLTSLAFFTFRVTGSLALDAHHLRSEVSSFSVTEAIMRLPEGILVADHRGRLLLLNDTMRSCLTDLGFPTDLADTRGLWAALQRKATQERAELLPHGVVLTLSTNETRLFSVDSVTLRGRLCQRILAIDITREELLNRRLEYTNDLLERASEELRSSLEGIDELARNDALLTAHSRVHDVIGQRLSILHRYLEDDQITDQSLASITPLLTETLTDLAGPGSPDGTADLQGIVDAFRIVNVDIEVRGDLPADPSVAGVFIQVIREAATNAVKHGQARTITVTLTTESYGDRLIVSNDGSPWRSRSPGRGTGIAGMRRAVANLGGRLTVRSLGVDALPVTISAMIPHQPIVSVEGLER